MVTLDVLEAWLVEYSAKKGFYDVVLELCSRKCHIPSVVSHIWLVLASVGQIVTSWEVDKFELAIELIEYVHASTKCVPFKIFAKLVTGLKMKLLLCQLLDGRTDVLNRLYQCFPRNGPNYIEEDQREVIRLRNVHSHFRKLYLTLIAHESQRLAYFRDEYEEEYGERWMQAVKLLMRKFIKKTTQHLPVTMIEKILRDGPEHYITKETTVTTEMFLEIVHGKSSLQSSDLMELLTMWNPVNTQDQVQTEYQLTITNQTDSNSDDKMGTSASILRLSQSSGDGTGSSLDQTVVKLNPVTAVRKSCREHMEHTPLSVQQKQTTCSTLKYPHRNHSTSQDDIKISANANRVIPVKHKLVRRPDHRGDSQGTNSTECGSPSSRTKRLCFKDHDTTRTDSNSVSQLEERGDIIADENRCNTQPIEIESSEEQVCIVSSSSDSSKDTPSADLHKEKSHSLAPVSEERQGNQHSLVCGEDEVTRLNVECDHVLVSDESDPEMCWEEYEDLSIRGSGRISDIDAPIHDQDGRIVPSSRNQSEEMPVSFVNLDIVASLPSIKTNIKKPLLKLCVIKLFHKKDLDRGYHKIFT